MKKMPVHVQDQWNAASADARQTFHSLGAAQKMRSNNNPTLAAMIDDLVDYINSEAFRGCEHVMRSPQPIFVNLASPVPFGRCMTCEMVLHTSIAGTEEDRRCDNCKTIVTKIRPVSAHQGTMIFCGGMCSPCFDKKGAS